MWPKYGTQLQTKPTQLLNNEVPLLNDACDWLEYSTILGHELYTDLLNRWKYIGGP